MHQMRILLHLSLEDRKSAKTTATRGSVAGGIMGRTVPSFRLALAEEESEWSEYRRYLAKDTRKDFDDLFTIPRLYLSACSGAVKLVKLDPIKLSILLHHFLELRDITNKPVEVLQPICH